MDWLARKGRASFAGSIMTVDELMALADALFEAGCHEANTGEGKTGDNIIDAEAKSLAARTTLRAALEAVVADAERWRYLRDGSADLMMCRFGPGMSMPCEVVVDMDAAITARLAGAKGEV